MGRTLGPDDGWGEAGGSSTALLGEFFVNGATTLAPGQEIGLGTAFNPAVFGAGVNGDLTFQFSSPGGGLTLGTVTYETGAATAIPEPGVMGMACVLSVACAAAFRRGSRSPGRWHVAGGASRRL